MTHEEYQKLLDLALRFWREKEAPDEGEVESMFHALIFRDFESLEVLLKGE